MSGLYSLYPIKDLITPHCWYYTDQWNRDLRFTLIKLFLFNLTEVKPLICYCIEDLITLHYWSAYDFCTCILHHDFDQSFTSILDKSLWSEWLLSELMGRQCGDSLLQSINQSINNKRKMIEIRYISCLYQQYFLRHSI